MNHNYSIKYRNVELRALEQSEIEFLRTWRNNPDNCKYLKQIGYISEEQQRKWYEGYLKNDNEILFAIVETEQLNRIVGTLSLYDFEDKQAEFGKILIGDEEAHGKKVGYNATVAILKFAFELLGLEKVVLHCYVNNIPALKVYEKSGFKVESEHMDLQGNAEYIMSVHKNEYEEED